MVKVPVGAVAVTVVSRDCKSARSRWKSGRSEGPFPVGLLAMLLLLPPLTPPPTTLVLAVSRWCRGGDRRSLACERSERCE